jgi:hypothetical protein
MWMAIAFVCAIFSFRNWNNVTLDLWGPLQADIKVPLLMALMFLLGFVPIWLVMRGRLWAARRKLIALERPIVTPPPPPLPTEATASATPSDD